MGGGETGAGVGWLVFLRSSSRHLRQNSHLEESITKVTIYSLVAMVTLHEGVVQSLRGYHMSPCHLRINWGSVSLWAFPVSRFFFPSTSTDVGQVLRQQSWGANEVNTLSGWWRQPPCSFLSWLIHDTWCSAPKSRGVKSNETEMNSSPLHHQ